MDRRAFLATAVSAAQVRAADGRIRAGVIGSGGRGQYLTANFKEIGAEVAAVCDVYEPNLKSGLAAASTGARGYEDYRRLLDDKSIDVVVVATPDHWHAQMVVDAVDAGKDVYVEKPMAHTIEDGFRMIEAVRRTHRVVQVGTQRRSFDLFQEARRIVASGALGDVRLVNSWWMNTTPAALKSRPLEGKLDWERWIGSAPKRPLDPLRFFNWYWFWDYSGGMMVGQAAHIIDAIHMLMNSSQPVAVTCAGKLTVGGAEVPETASMSVEYADYMAVFTIGYKAMRYATFCDQMNQFHGNKARFDVGREAFSLYPEDPRALDPKPSIVKRQPGTFEPATRAHIRNFLDCVASRQDPNATVEIGQATSIVLAMAMHALRTGRRVRWNANSRKMEG